MCQTRESTGPTATPALEIRISKGKQKDNLVNSRRHHLSPAGSSWNKEKQNMTWWENEKIADEDDYCHSATITNATQHLLVHMESSAFLAATTRIPISICTFLTAKR